LRSWLSEKGIGLDVGCGKRVPIVPAAVIFDLHVSTTTPDAAAGYAACEAANSEAVVEGRVGAGAGATIGKVGGEKGHCCFGGVGTASIHLQGCGTIAALVVVNAWGDVVDPDTGAIVAGAKGEDGEFLDTCKHLLAEQSGPPTGSGLFQNTTIAVVATDVKLSKGDALRVAKMAQTGLCNAIRPAHSLMDGDTVFCISTAKVDMELGATDICRLGAAAAKVLATAIVRGARLGNS